MEPSGQALAQHTAEPEGNTRAAVCEEPWCSHAENPGHLVCGPGLLHPVTLDKVPPLSKLTSSPPRGAQQP